jgi:hypothetical protein
MLRVSLTCVGHSTDTTLQSVEEAAMDFEYEANNLTG